MTAKTLRPANSAYYGLPRQISTVRAAVVLIGFRAVQATAVAPAMVDLFPGGNRSRLNSDLLWAHSAACALIAEAVTKGTRQARSDEAFTAGIRNDMGRLVLAQYAGDAFN
jgi:HD-like signal output (HDOD) protein